MTREILLQHLRDLRACGDAQTWARDTPGTPAQIWAKCPRGDWMLWLAGRAGIDRRTLVLAAIACAETAPGHTDENALQAALTLHITEEWAHGREDIETVRDAAYAADVYAAAYAAYAADAAHDAAAAAAAYATAAARIEHRQLCADLVRANIPWSVVAAALGSKKP